MNKKVPLTVVIPTLNESEQMSDALAALNWADEVIIADGGSSDDTVTRSEQLGAKVMTVPGRTIGAQRNAAIAVAKNEWILALDADERPGVGLAEEISKVIADRSHNSYRIRFRNFYLGREVQHGRWARDWHVRLFRRDNRFSDSQVHEKLIDSSNIGALEANIMHSPYRDISHHVSKIILYARLGAQGMYARGSRASARHLVVNPLWRFGKDYFINGSIKDGRLGFVMAVLSGFSTFMKYANLLALSLQDQKQKKGSLDT